MINENLSFKNIRWYLWYVVLFWILISGSITNIGSVFLHIYILLFLVTVTVTKMDDFYCLVVWSLFSYFRNGFVSTVQRLALLRDPNIAQIVAACTQDEPLCVLSEFSEYGDLCQFLRSHHLNSHYSNTNDLNTSLSSGSSASPSGLK